MKVIVFGNGWLGNKFADYFSCKLVPVDICDVNQVRKALEAYNPEVVINTAGKVGRPNIDWCELNKEVTAHVNIGGPVTLARACQEAQVKLVHLSSGCLWDQKLDAKEDDTPEPPSFYSFSKAEADRILMQMDVQPLILRLRMPVCGEHNPRNLITKVASYKTITNLPNSLTYVDDLLATAHILLELGASGIFNVVNPGVTNLAEIMDLYAQYVDPKHTYSVISKEELLKITLAGRSDCTMNTDKLTKLKIYLPPIGIRLPECMEEYRQ